MTFDNLLESVLSGPVRPDHPFLKEGMTCGQLYAQANAIRMALAKAGCAADTPVCLYAENRGLMAAAMLAALSGAPPLFLPYDYSTHTLMEARKNIDYDFALVQGHRPLPEGVIGIPIPDYSALDTGERLRNLRAPDDTWLYLFTGGSTGSPRIWSKSPRNLLSEAANLAVNYDIQETDVILSSVPANHIYGLLYSVMLPLVSGASVDVRTPSYPNEIIQAMADSEATVFVSIPAHYRALKPMQLPPVKIHTAFSSGGALLEEDDRAFFQATGIAVNEIYGSTETGGIAFRQRNAGQTALRPFSYVDVAIEGEQLRVRSDFLSDELERDPEDYFMTADRVVPVDGGLFEILGRSDGIVKVGGKRVDMAHIRQALVKIDGVEDAYVMAMPVKSGRENEIVALVTGAGDPGHIMQQLKTDLPPYALPRSIKMADRIPMSATGKYNREAIEKIIISGR